MTATPLTEQQKSDAAHVASLMREGVPLRLDLADERQYRHAVAMHTLGGQTPERNPGLHAALATSRAHYQAGGPPPADATALAATPADAGFASDAAITVVAPRQSNAAGSAAFVSLLGGATTLNAVLFVNDPSGNRLATGSASSYNDGAYLPVETAVDGARQATSSMTGYMQYTWQTEVGGPVYVANLMLSRNAGVLADPVVTQPVQAPKHASSPYIRIGLGRGNPGETTDDVDYWFWQGTSDTTYAVPLVGTAQFASEVLPLAPDTLIINGKLSRGAQSGGGSVPIPPKSLQMLRDNCQLITPTKLQWTLPAGDKESAANPLVFGTIPWDTSAVTYLYVQFTAFLKGTPFPSVAVIQSSDHLDEDPLDGVANIKPLQFLYHCLAEGTLVLLADGSSKPVEALSSRDVLRTGEGGEARVTSTWVARHRGPVVVLATDGGHELVMSHNHVVMTPGGPMTAEELEEGGSVRVRGGTARITGVRREDFDGLLCNASVSEHDQPADPARNTLFANGVQVCDFEVQTQHRHARRTHPDVVRASIDPVFLPDYENWLAERAQAAAR